MTPACACGDATREGVIHTEHTCFPPERHDAIARCRVGFRFGREQGGHTAAEVNANIRHMVEAYDEALAQRDAAIAGQRTARIELDAARTTRAGVTEALRDAEVLIARVLEGLEDLAAGDFAERDAINLAAVNLADLRRWTRHTEAPPCADCRKIQHADPLRHFSGCPKREPLPEGHAAVGHSAEIDALRARVSELEAKPHKWLELTDDLREEVLDRLRLGHLGIGDEGPGAVADLLAAFSPSTPDRYATAPVGATEAVRQAMAAAGHCFGDERECRNGYCSCQCTGCVAAWQEEAKSHQAAQARLQELEAQRKRGER